MLNIRYIGRRYRCIHTYILITNHNSQDYRVKVIQRRRKKIANRRDPMLEIYTQVGIVTHENRTHGKKER